MVVVYLVTILLCLVFNSMIIFGIQAAFSFEYGQGEDGRSTLPYGDGHIFGYPHFKLEKALGETVMKPLISCVVCMSPVHGFWLYWFAVKHLIQEDFGLLGNSVFCVLYILALAGLNAIIYASNTD